MKCLASGWTSWPHTRHDLGVVNGESGHVKKPCTRSWAHARTACIGQSSSSKLAIGVGLFTRCACSCGDMFSHAASSRRSDGQTASCMYFLRCSRSFCGVILGGGRHSLNLHMPLSCISLSTSRDQVITCCWATFSTRVSMCSSGRQSTRASSEIALASICVLSFTLKPNSHMTRARAVGGPRLSVLRSQ